MRDKNKRMYYTLSRRILLLVFLFFVFGVFIFNMLGKDKTFSDQENRNLKTKPEFSIDKLLHKKYTSNYEKYLSDQFVSRDFWVNVKSTSERFSGKKENNDVYLGQDGYLIAKFKSPKEDDINERLKAINTFSKDNENISKYVMIVPNQVRILEDKLPQYAPEKDQLKVIDNFYSKLDKGIKTISTYDELNAKKEEYLYYKTDHHWTTKGAYYGYREFSEVLGIKPKEESDYNIKKVSNDFYGTLYSRAGVKGVTADEVNVYVPKKEEPIVVNYMEEKKKSASMYSSEALEEKDKYQVFFGGNHSIVRIKTSVDSKKKLLVIKDSYANSFVPFLTSHFSDIIMVDLRYYADNIDTLIKDYGITDTLILYNVNTFFEDESILNISNYE